MSNEHNHRIYVTAVDAAKLLGKSTRQIHRYIDDGKLPAQRNESGHLCIDVSDVEALGDIQLELLKPIEELNTQAQTINALKAQLDELRAANATMREAFTAQLAAQDERIDRLQGTIRREYEAQSILHKLMSMRPDALESVDMETRQEKRATVGSLARELSVLAKRDLPPGSVTVAAFCKRHSGPQTTVHTSTVKGMIEAAHRVADLVTIHERTTASTNIHEWWLKPQQQPEMIRFWQEHGKLFEPCPQCPHAMDAAEPGAEKTISDEMLSAEIVL